jgi:UDP-glucose 4-epimerase
MAAPQRIAITGGAGFIGLHTVRRLMAEGLRLLVIDDDRHACGVPLPPEVDHEALDIGAPQAAAAIVRFRPDAIVHLAAQGGVSRSVRDPAGDALVNVVGTVAMLKAAFDAGCRRFVFASSGGAIYGHARRLPTPETAAPNPLSPYGAAKLAGEGYLGMFERTFRLLPVALRYSNVYGPYQDGTGEAGLVAITATRLIGGRPPEVRGDGQQTRDFVYVEDVAEANLRAVISRVRGPINIGTGRATSVLEVARELMAAAGHQGEVDFVAAREGEVRHTALDIRRAAARLGWTPRTSLADGLSQTFRSFQQRPPAAATDARG